MRIDYPPNDEDCHQGRNPVSAPDRDFHEEPPWQGPGGNDGHSVEPSVCEPKGGLVEAVFPVEAGIPVRPRVGSALEHGGNGATDAISENVGYHAQAETVEGNHVRCRYGEEQEASHHLGNSGTPLVEDRVEKVGLHA